MKKLKLLYNAFTTYWTMWKKLFLLIGVLFAVLLYYVLAIGGGNTIRIMAKLKEAFSYSTFFPCAWEEFFSSGEIADYFAIMTPFIIFYIFFWFKPTITRFLFSAAYMFLVAKYYLSYLKYMMDDYSLPYILSHYPEYASQVPYWIKLIFA